MTYYVIPSRDEWARKLGASATVRTTDPGPPGVDPDYQLDDGDAAVTVTGSGWNRVEDPRYFQDDQLENSGGSGAESVTWNFSDLDVGWYDVRITWRKDNDHSKKARYEIFDGTTSLDSFTLNQREAPSGPRVDGVRWESVGVYPITSGSLAVELTDKGSSTVVADGVMLVPVTNSISVNSIEKSMDDESVTAHVSVTENTP